MKEAILYQKLPEGKVRCNVCLRRCLISKGGVGYCRTRINRGGKLYTTIYGVVSSLNNDPIEKKPVFHFAPGSFCLSAGTFGCNFRCLFCQNWEISWADGVAEAQYGQKISPPNLVDLAYKYQSAGIAITYNEPAIWLEYSLEVFKKIQNSKSLPRRQAGKIQNKLKIPACPAGRQNSKSKIRNSPAWRQGRQSVIRNRLYTVWVTNGYATPEAIDVIAPYLDVYRVDLKSFDDKFYQKLINVPSAAPIFETTLYVHKNYPKIHIECVTNIIPGWNDDPETLAAVARWIKKNLGDLTPWHVTRFFPYAKLTDVPPTPPETLYKAREVGLKEGLKFVYIGNLPVEEEDDTFCPKCGSLAIRRDGYSTQVLAVTPEGKCQKCGEDLNIKMI